MIKYFPVLLTISFIVSADGLTIRDKEIAADNAEKSILRSDYDAFKKNLKKAYNIAIGEKVTPLGVHHQVKFEEAKIFIKKDAELFASYLCKAQEQIDYYKSEKFKNYQSHRSVGVICGATIFGGLFVNAVQKFNVSEELFGFVILGSLGGGMIGYYANKFIAPRYDSFKQDQAESIKITSVMIKEKADLDLKIAKEAKKENLRQIIREELAHSSNKKQTYASPDFDKKLEEAMKELGISDSVAVNKFKNRLSQKISPEQLEDLNAESKQESDGKGSYLLPGVTFKAIPE
ncbi:hypothetical protein HYX58_03605 [Candidatus Dependentiae bacterium]|nr:hypothetical protein [Candidatus Dependentiae bacterium]